MDNGRTFHRIIVPSRCALACSIVSSSMRKQVLTDTTGPPPRSRRTTSTRPFAGSTAGAGALTITKDSIACPTTHRCVVRRRCLDQPRRPKTSLTSCAVSYLIYMGHVTSRNLRRSIFGTPLHVPDWLTAITVSLSRRFRKQISKRWERIVPKRIRMWRRLFPRFQRRNRSKGASVPNIATSTWQRLMP